MTDSDNLPGGEYVTVGILDMDYVEGTGMSFPVDDGTDTTQVTASSNHAQVT